MATEEPAKICPYSLPDLKNTTDDHIPTYLTSHKYTQSHTLTDVRLAIGFTACSIAAVTFYLDFTKGFEKMKEFTFYAVVAYFVLNSILTVWVWGVEGGKIFVGSRQGIKVSITSKTEKYSHIYHLTIRQTYPNDPIERVHEVKSSFTNWFTEEGKFMKKPFEAFLMSSIPSLAVLEKDKEAVEDLVDKSALAAVSGSKAANGGSVSGKRKSKK